jgi:hypothetical protein
MAINELLKSFGLKTSENEPCSNVYTPNVFLPRSDFDLLDALIPDVCRQVAPKIMTPAKYPLWSLAGIQEPVTGYDPIISAWIAKAYGGLIAIDTTMYHSFNLMPTGNDYSLVRYPYITICVSGSDIKIHPKSYGLTEVDFTRRLLSHSYIPRISAVYSLASFLMASPKRGELQEGLDVFSEAMRSVLVSRPLTDVMSANLLNWMSKGNA